MSTFLKEQNAHFEHFYPQSLGKKTNFEKKFPQILLTCPYMKSTLLVCPEVMIDFE